MSPEPRYIRESVGYQDGAEDHVTTGLGYSVWVNHSANGEQTVSVSERDVLPTTQFPDGESA